MTLLLFLKPSYRALLSKEERREIKRAKKRAKKQSSEPPSAKPAATAISAAVIDAERARFERRLAELKDAQGFISGEIARLHAYLRELQEERKDRSIRTAFQVRYLLGQIAAEEKKRRKYERDVETVMRFLLEMDDD